MDTMLTAVEAIVTHRDVLNVSMRRVRDGVLVNVRTTTRMSKGFKAATLADAVNGALRWLDGGQVG